MIEGQDNDTKLLLPERLLSIWLKEFISYVSEIGPRFLALHLQEVGGKTYENSMDHVQDFIRRLCESSAFSDYIYVRIYMDEDFKSAENFTALGNIYFAHKDLNSLRLWNFLTHDWENKLDERKLIFTGNIETISTKEKAKFPQNFFPECKWSRKGFMRTRWEVNGTVIDLVNIHLFHDASNLAACEDFPSVYCKTRRRALVHTVERFHLDNKNGSVPFFLFGDFNFRCDTAGVVKELTKDLTVHRVQNIKNESTKIHYRNTIGNNILTVGKKEFSHADHQLKFKEFWLKKFDRELEPLIEILSEYPINFIPSYPFEEDPEMPTDYMSTRCPSWCDRILMSPQMKEIISNNGWKYDMIGESVCMGDHKPIYLTVHLRSNKGTYSLCDCSNLNFYANNNNSLTSPGKRKCCHYSFKLYTDILNESKKQSCRIIQNESRVELPLSYPNESNSKILQTETSQALLSTSHPTISINIIDSDNIFVCMCTSTFSTNRNYGYTEGTICPMCNNIIKLQPLNYRYKLISNSVVLSDNIIVNRIDTQFLNTSIETSLFDPYTPESNESHSPYPELRSTSTTASSNCSNIYSSELLIDNTEKIQSSVYIKSKLGDDPQHSTRTKKQDEEMCAGVQSSKKSTSRGAVTPVQLKSRLEDLQKISLYTSERDSISLEKSDVGNVEDICTSKAVSKSQNRKSNIFSQCCCIH
ncbi:inositol polyphosphate-5-phosphatase A isoform X2 [Drosophila busckii]|uniref:inositol polyphosphate-5-phosphatase A isoform X2 n=1 Tax=Drosophila busckii TaxID=30019 RepID=UPI00083E998A|nr:inositol polyphosphate-5-phosphatase A isoform X2 [Drosophila busckii]